MSNRRNNSPDIFGKKADMTLECTKIYRHKCKSTKYLAEKNPRFSSYQFSVSLQKQL